MNPKADLLIVDIGNTSATLSIRESGGVRIVGRYLREHGAANNVKDAATKWAGLTIDGIAIASVVPDLTTLWAHGMASALGVDAWELVPGAALPIPVSYPNPESIGADRLANAVAAAHYCGGGPAVVADFGTALTFDILGKARGYVGGVIAPGIAMMYQYLGEKTALLPVLEPAPASVVVGKSTEEAMHAGAFFGYRGMVREIFHEVARQSVESDISFLATGGFAATVLQDFHEPVTVVPDLTLQGIGLAWDHANT